MTNLGPPSRCLEDSNNTEQVVNEVAVAGISEENRDEIAQSDNDTVFETTSSHPPKTGKKSKSRAQVEREELAEKIINFASKEDHPVDLELAALCSQIKRKLPDPDDQDDLLDEIKDVARAFFQRKKHASNNVSTVQPVRQTPSPPPPPLQIFPQQQQQQQQEQGSGDMTSQYSTVNYLTDGTTGATYMTL